MWGPEGWGPNGGGPKISRFSFPSPAPIFVLFFSLWGSSRVFFSLSGGLLVSFFLSLGVFSWNFGGVLVGQDPQMCAFSPSGCRVKAPGGLQAAGVSPWRSSRTFDRCRGRRGSMSLEPWGMRACFDSTAVTGHVLLDICFVVSPSRIIVNVVCSILTHSRNTCQGTVHVQLCSLRVSRRVFIRHTLFQSVHSSDLGPHMRLFKQDHVEPSLLFFFWGCFVFFGIFSMSKIFFFFKK